MYYEVCIYITIHISYRNMLKLGSSKDWDIALEAITGTRNMSAEPLVEYFQPVMDWLTAYNAEHNPNDEGWTDECPTDLPEVGSR